MSERDWCKAVTLKGTRCKNHALIQGYCALHSARYIYFESWGKRKSVTVLAWIISITALLLTGFGVYQNLQSSLLDESRHKEVMDAIAPPEIALPVIVMKRNYKTSELEKKEEPNEYWLVAMGTHSGREKNAHYYVYGKQASAGSEYYNMGKIEAFFPDRTWIENVTIVIETDTHDGDLWIVSSTDPNLEEPEPKPIASLESLPNARVGPAFRYSVQKDK